MTEQEERDLAEHAFVLPFVFVDGHYVDGLRHFAVHGKGDDVVLTLSCDRSAAARQVVQRARAEGLAVNLLFQWATPGRDYDVHVEHHSIDCVVVEYGEVADGGSDPETRFVLVGQHLRSTRVATMQPHRLTLVSNSTATEDLGPDERVFAAQADTLRRLGPLRGLRQLVDRYLADPRLAAFPSPLRWLWLLLRSVTDRASPRLLPLLALVVAPLACARLAGTWWAAACCAACPLMLHGARRQLQDSSVAALTVVACALARDGHYASAAVACAALLALKEAAVFSLPAVVLCAVAWRDGAAVACLGVVAYLVVTSTVVPRASEVLERLLTAHRTAYTEQHQRGGAHRLLVDLALLSPVPLLAAALSTRSPLTHAAGATLVSYGLSPVQNARTTIAADLLLRCALASHLASLDLPYAAGACACLVAVDLYVAWRTRRVYDPVTAQLLRAIGAA